MWNCNLCQRKRFHSGISSLSNGVYGWIAWPSYRLSVHIQYMSSPNWLYPQLFPTDKVEIDVFQDIHSTCLRVYCAAQYFVLFVKRLNIQLKNLSKPDTDWETKSIQRFDVFLLNLMKSQSWDYSLAQKNFARLSIVINRENVFLKVARRAESLVW
jgi:hypothetical protein